MTNNLLNFSFADEYGSFSFADEYGSLTVYVFFSSNIHSGIIACSVSFLKLGIVSLTKLDGKPVFQYFSVIFHISLSKFIKIGRNSVCSMNLSNNSIVSITNRNLKIPVNREFMWLIKNLR